MEKIGPGEYKYVNRPEFARYPKTSEDWHIWGPVDKLSIGTVVEVAVYSQHNELKAFEILSYVAERIVSKRDGSKVRFVMCTFDGIMEEGSDE